MTFTIATAVGTSACTSLREHAVSPVQPHRQVAEHAGMAVVWPTNSPFVSSFDDGNVLVVLDGYVHNLVQSAVGQAEALARRYITEGRRFASDVEGDFVAVVLDRRSKTMLVSRDPLGVRPWYVTGSGSRHAGASDLATLASLPWIDLTLDEGALIRYLAALTESDAGQVYTAIRPLGPGRTMSWHDGRMTEFAHHRWRFEPDMEVSWEEAVERCRSLLDDAVRRRLCTGITPTSELSGGLDSSAVVGTLAELDPDNLIVGRLMFTGRSADERTYSDAVIEQWGLDAISVPPWTPTDDEIVELTERLKRPVPDPHFTMFMTLQQAFAERGRNTSFTGLAGDDAFVAMSSGSRMVSALQLRQWPVLRQVAVTSLRSPRDAWRSAIGPLFYRVTKLAQVGPPEWVTSQAAARADLRELMNCLPARMTGIAAIDERIDGLLTDFDSGNLETRAVVCDLTGHRDSHPFFDLSLIRDTYGLNPSWPVRNGHTRALQATAYRDRLPAKVADRRSKAEFSVTFWEQLLRSNLLEALRTGPLVEHGWLDRAGFERLVEKAKSGSANAALPLSRCVMLDRFVRSR